MPTYSAPSASNATHCGTWMEAIRGGAWLRSCPKTLSGHHDPRPRYRRRGRSNLRRFVQDSAANVLKAGEPVREAPYASMSAVRHQQTALRINRESPGLSDPVMTCQQRVGHTREVCTLHRIRIGNGDSSRRASRLVREGVAVAVVRSPRHQPTGPPGPCPLRSRRLAAQLRIDSERRPDGPPVRRATTVRPAPATAPRDRRRFDVR